MGLFSTCQRDPLMDLLKSTFNATPIRIPGEQYVPLGVIAHSNKEDKFLGMVTNFLTDQTIYPDQPIESRQADISNTKTSEINFDLGFDLLSGFLRGMGINGGSLKAHFNGVQKVSFSFMNVTKRWLDIGRLGIFLQNKKFDIKNPANDYFLKADASCIVIDSTINSNNFSMNVEKSSGQDFKLDIPAIQDAVGNVKTDLKIRSSGSMNISFEGNLNLAFAFSAINFSLSEDGSISFIPAEFKAQSGNLGLIDMDKTIFTPNRYFLYEDEGLINFD